MKQNKWSMINKSRKKYDYHHRNFKFNHKATTLKYEDIKILSGKSNLYC